MRDLVSRILPVYQEHDTDRYLTNLSALQLVAGNYQGAWQARQSLRDRRRKADAGRPVSKAMIYDLYAQAKAIETADHVAFSQAYTLTYRAVVPKLSDLDAYALSGWLELPVSGFQEALQKALRSTARQGQRDASRCCRSRRDVSVVRGLSQLRAAGCGAGRRERPSALRQRRRHPDQDTRWRHAVRQDDAAEGRHGSAAHAARVHHPGRCAGALPGNVPRTATWE